VLCDAIAPHVVRGKEGRTPRRCQTADRGMAPILPSTTFGRSPQPAMISPRKVTSAKMTLCNFFFTTFFTLWRSEVALQQRSRNTAERKDAVDKTLNRAGATPLCAAFSRPKSSWGRSRARHAGRVL
jgi:hypothetical protein